MGPPYGSGCEQQYDALESSKPRYAVWTSASPFLSHSIEIPSSRAASEILYVLRMFSFIPLR